MPSQQELLEEPVRQLMKKGLSTRAIVAELARRGVQTSQSTVVLVQRKLRTRPEQSRNRVPVRAAAALAVALVVLAAVAASIIWVRFLRAAPAPARSPQVTVCVRYSATGDITGLRAGPGCPPGWAAVVLSPGGSLPSP
jgi:hypothetical protein